MWFIKSVYTPTASREKVAPTNTSSGIVLIKQNNVWKTKLQYWYGFHQRELELLPLGVVVVVVMASEDFNQKERREGQAGEHQV